MYSCRFYRSFLQLASEVQRKDYLKNVLPKPPVILMSGTQDMVGDTGAYAQAKAGLLIEKGFDVRLEIIDGMRHSILPVSYTHLNVRTVLYRKG